MRHANADVGRDVPGPGEWWKKCGEGHRMLSERGRAQAVQIGQAIRQLGIPISEVRSSEYCRAVETSRLLALGDPKTDARLNGWPAWKAVNPEHGLDRLAEGTRVFWPPDLLMETWCLSRTNRIFPIPRPRCLQTLKTANQRSSPPMVRAGFVLSGRIKPEDWQAIFFPLTNLF